MERLEGRDLPAASFQILPVLPFHDLAVLDHARATFSYGQSIGRQANVVLKIGDSNSSPFYASNYLSPLGSPTYDPTTSGLAESYGNLLDTWWTFRSGPDSLAHEGPTAKPGWRTDVVLGALDGEVRATHAAIALVMIGTNDAFVFGDAAGYRDRLSRIVSRLLKSGVVPVLSTLPDSQLWNGRYESTLLVFNQVIANVAKRFDVPLWNLWPALQRLPGHGLSADGVHLAASPNGAGSFEPYDLLFAQNLRNLQSLQILDWFREHVAVSPAVSLPHTAWEPLESSHPVYAIGRDGGSASIVSVFDGTTGKRLDCFLPFGPRSADGVRVITGDINGDGFTDLVCTNQGRSGWVKVISGGDGSSLGRFKPFAHTTGRALEIALGDLDDDGSMEIVAARTGVKEVRAFDGKSLTLQSKFLVPDLVNGPLSIAVAYPAGWGPVIVLASGKQHVAIRYFRPSGELLSLFFPVVPPGLGLALAAVDLTGDGHDEIVLGRLSKKQQLLVLDGTTHSQLAEFALEPLADASFGIRLGTMRSTFGADTLLVGSAPGMSVSVRGFDDLSGMPELLPIELPDRAFGLFVG